MTLHNVATPNVAQETQCKHHWVIDAPSGPLSRGVCRICGVEKMFKNYIDPAPWGEATPTDGGSRRYPAARSARAEGEEEVA